ncbi:hypothetical protein [Legionella spiritensis]|uniref:Uncharacterized protein n=1 Tax=Legionella spiritensis TaxID=452 RepID=A0A0W0Z7C4_LEGSP|nr:hypothetical protein [Legionella spiritensis]KTD64831.1 hypothetical protein Lspi_0998 [Legionella spiritensis]SNV40441.1 Uncharacterised protein [Legionella spiritensis]
MPVYNIITPKEWENFSSGNGIENTQIQSALGRLYQNTTIYERLDNLIALYDACQAHEPANNKISEIQEQAARFIEIIGNSPDIENTIEQRRTMRRTWPNYLPNTTLQHLRPFRTEQSREEKILHRISDHFRALGSRKLLDVNKQDKVHDKLFNVTMLTPLEKEEFRVMPSEGRLWQLNQPVDEETALSIAPFDTTEMHAHNNAQGRAIFVLSPQGELFAGLSEMGKFHHSSFQSGGYVAYGGTFAVNNGRLDYIDDYSGHYTPKAQQFFNVLKELKNRNLIHEDTQINKKFNENIGLKVGSNLLNTRGFLGLQGKSIPKEQEPIDHYQTIQLFLYASDLSFDNPIWRTFAIVMHEHLNTTLLATDEDETMTEHYEEIIEFQNDLGIQPDFVKEHPLEYQEHVENFKKMVESNKGLMDDLGGNINWLHVYKPEETQTNTI